MEAHALIDEPQMSTAAVEIDDAAAKAMPESLVRIQRLQSVGRAALGVAHDLGNWLTVINANATALERGVGDENEMLTTIREAANLATALTRQLIDFARDRDVARYFVSINDIVRGAERVLACMLGTDVTLKLELGDAGVVLANPTQIEQVIMNLALNASDAMERGGEVLIETRTVLCPSISRGGSCTAITVHDQGHGMDESTVHRAFEPFFTTKGNRGSGLGLAVVRRIVHDCDGKLDVVSVPGKGTSISVYLPNTRPLDEPHGSR